MPVWRVVYFIFFVCAKYMYGNELGQFVWLQTLAQMGKFARERREKRTICLSTLYDILPVWVLLPARTMPEMKGQNEP